MVASRGGVLDSAFEGQVGAAPRIGHPRVFHYRYRDARLPYKEDGAVNQGTDDIQHSGCYRFFSTASTIQCSRRAPAGFFHALVVFLQRCLR